MNPKTGIGLLLVVLVAFALVSKANGEREAARALARDADNRAEAASQEAQGAWKAYTEKMDSVVILADSLAAARHRAEDAATKIRLRVDTVRAMVPDTGAVPRPIHDAVVQSYEELVLAVTDRAETAEAEVSLWRERWSVADSGWTFERETTRLLRVSVANWQRLAEPPWWERARRNIGVVAGTAAVAILAWEIAR